MIESFSILFTRSSQNESGVLANVLSRVNLGSGLLPVVKLPSCEYRISLVPRYNFDIKMRETYFSISFWSIWGTAKCSVTYT
jgi:hypothetical protein